MKYAAPQLAKKATIRKGNRFRVNQGWDLKGRTFTCLRVVRGARIKDLKLGPLIEFEMLDYKHKMVRIAIPPDWCDKVW